jgi:hypothetical protein
MTASASLDALYEDYSDVDEYAMDIEPDVVDKLGIKLYDKVSDAIAELIANSYDADAENVRVKLPLGRYLATRKADGTLDEKGFVIEVIDDGHGMTPVEADTLFLRVGRDRRDEQGETKRNGHAVMHGREKRCEHGKDKAMDNKPWEAAVIDAVREEAYYFAGQKQTKVMNEGWATYWESVMMGGEGFAGPDEFLTYADHMARVLGSDGLNPYKLGFELWTHVELRAARREVLDKLLRVEGVTPENFHSRVDLDEVAALLGGVEVRLFNDLQAAAYPNDKVYGFIHWINQDDDCPWILLSRNLEYGPRHQGTRADLIQWETHPQPRILWRIGRYPDHPYAKGHAWAFQPKVSVELIFQDQQPCRLLIWLGSGTADTHECKPRLLDLTKTLVKLHP